MTGRGRGRNNMGKMHLTKGGEKLIRPGDLTTETDRRCCQSQAPSQPTSSVQPMPPRQVRHTPTPIQPTPPRQLHPTPQLVHPTPSVQPMPPRKIRHTPPPIQPTAPRQFHPIPPLVQPTPPQQVYPTPPLVQPTPPRQVHPTPPPVQHKLKPVQQKRKPLQPIPPPSHSTFDSFTMIPTPGYTPYRHFEHGNSSHSQQPPLGVENEELHQEEEEAHEGGDEQEPPLQVLREYARDANGKFILRPLGRGWTPSSKAAEGIRKAIQSQFRGPYHCWSETPEDVREYWWKEFGENLSWNPNDNDCIKHTFNQRGAKRLSDILQKVRMKGVKPSWMGDKAYADLLAYWKGKEFKKISAQNKTNRASSKGGAIHTTGQRAHLEVALDLAHQLGRSVDPDEIFLATHKKRSGSWVDNRAQTTYENYHHRLSQIQKEKHEASSSETQQIDGAKKLGLWKEVAGGKTRGRCYGTAYMSSNLRCGISSLIQEPQRSTSRFVDEEVSELRDAVARAEQKAAKAETHNNELERQLHVVMERMTALERQSSGASYSETPAHHHPHYDDDLDDHSLDEDEDSLGYQ